MTPLAATQTWADLPKISEALSKKPVNLGQASNLASQIAGAVVCAIITSKDGGKRLRNLWYPPRPIDVSKLGKQERVAGYVAALGETVEAASPADRDRHELLENVLQDGAMARRDWHFKHVKKG